MSDADDLITRMRQVLGDTGSIAWTTEQLTEGLNHAYTDFRAMAGDQYVLNGLNGEVNPTNFATYYFALLVRGALGYAMLGRAAERTYAFNYDQDLVGAALAAGKANLEQFEKGLLDLKKVRIKNLQVSVDAPFPTETSGGGWELEE
jgi:hypothetical protein